MGAAYFPGSLWIPISPKRVNFQSLIPKRQSRRKMCHPKVVICQRPQGPLRANATQQTNVQRRCSADAEGDRMQRPVIGLYPDIVRHIPAEISCCSAKQQRKPISLWRRVIHCSYCQTTDCTSEHAMACCCSTSICIHHMDICEGRNPHYKGS